MNLKFFTFSKAFLFLPVFVAATLVKAQVPNKVKNDLLDKEWSKGEVALKNGAIVKGEVDYKEIAGIVLFKTDKEETSYTAEHLISFEFYDEENKTMKKFISIPFDLYNSGYEKLTFFQVAYESNNIAFISRKEFESKQNTHLTGGAAPSSISTPHGNVMTGGSAPEIYNYDIFEQREIFYLATPEGLVKPYIKNTYKVVNDLFKFKGSSFVERDALKEVLENKYDQCEKYAKDNKLSLKDKDDVLKVLQFSESID